MKKRGLYRTNSVTHYSSLITLCFAPHSIHQSWSPCSIIERAFYQLRLILR